MTLSVGDVVGILDDLYPPETAQDWDSVGLVVGDRNASVSKIIYAVDPVSSVVLEARQLGADLIVAHHPLLLRGIHAVSNDHPKGRLVTELIKNDIALFTAHTNADLPAGGTVDALAELLGLQHRRPLRPAPERPLDKIITFVPTEQATALIDALAEAGAGAIGNYDRCAFSSAGLGTFRPLAGSDPFLGSRDRVEEVTETRIEMVLERSRREAVLQALHTSHPYQVPAYDLVELAPTDGDAGLGRLGTLAEPVTLREFADRLAGALPATAAGARVSGDLDRLVSTVAVQAGAGDDLLDQARQAGADVYVTSDLRHHPASEARAWAKAPALVDIPHWAAEWTWLPVVQRLVDERLSAIGHDVETAISGVSTDPWNYVAH